MEEAPGLGINDVKSSCVHYKFSSLLLCYDAYRAQYIWLRGYFEEALPVLVKKRTRRLSGCLKIVRLLVIVLVVMIIAGAGIITFFPDVAAQNVDRLRNIIGDGPVAELESFVFSVQDSAQQFAYQLGLTHPDALWTPPPGDISTRAAVANQNPTASSAPASAVALAATSPATVQSTIGVSVAIAATTIPSSTVPAPPPSSSVTNPAKITNTPLKSATMAATASRTGLPPSLTSVLVTDVATTANVPLKSATIAATATRTVLPVSQTPAPAADLAATMTLPNAASLMTVAITPVPTISASPTSAAVTVPATTTVVPENTSTVAATATPLSLVTAIPTSIAELNWQLAPLTPFGKLAGEGQWLPYIQSANNQTVIAYRTFLQPDPERPYALPSVVAFNLRASRLHFVLGSVDPVPATPQPSRTGTIPAVDMHPGILIAAFNGGFKARHGHYGAMADGLVALPALDGLATAAIYANGSVKIGEWGIDIKDSPDLVAWRQNGKIMISNGIINPATAITSLSWGLTVKSTAITWRSALGLSADRQTLYYIGGPSLDVSTLTKAMAQTGVASAMELDINYFWVHFTAIRTDGSSLTAEPLLAEMKQKVDRYLKLSTDDFFYVTIAQ